MGVIPELFYFFAVVFVSYLDLLEDLSVLLIVFLLLLAFDVLEELGLHASRISYVEENFVDVFVVPLLI